MQEPFYRQVSATSNASIYSLYTLLQAAAPASTTVRKVCSQCIIQADFAGGAAKYWIGNSDITAGSGGAGSGVQLAASQAQQLGPFSSNLIHLDEIYLTSDTNGAKWNVTVITR